LEIEYLQYFGACSALSGFRMNEKEKKTAEYIRNFIRRKQQDV
jgi:hypothetical protein